MPSHSVLIRFEVEGGKKNRQNGCMLLSAIGHPSRLPKTSNQEGKHKHAQLHNCTTAHTQPLQVAVDVCPPSLPLSPPSIQANLPLKWHWLCGLCLPRRIWSVYSPFFYFFFSAIFFFFFKTNLFFFVVVILFFCLFLLFWGSFCLFLHTSGRDRKSPRWKLFTGLSWFFICFKIK